MTPTTTTTPTTVDLLAVFAHPDDAELLCGGTLARAADQGHRVGILDLTGGESGSAGSASLRAREAGEAARILGVATRASAGLPDAALVNSPDARLAVAAHIRALKPRTVILHWPSARHPDHRAAAELARDACFVAGLSKAAIEGAPHRPTKILHAVAYQEPPVEPRFVVDITDQMERKLEAVAAFRSQFEGKTWAGDIFGAGDRPLLDQIRAHAAHYGAMIRRPYGEPFWTRETVLVDDVVALAVRSL
ncbi:MAG TPA: bacillithiol biosynthesis deacetylase BshB1 [Longimicrobiales bacterium]